MYCKNLFVYGTRCCLTFVYDDIVMCRTGYRIAGTYDEDFNWTMTVSQKTAKLSIANEYMCTLISYCIELTKFCACEEWIVPCLKCPHTSRGQDHVSKRKALHRWQNGPQNSWQINHCSMNLQSSCKVIWSSKRRSQSACVWSRLAAYICPKIMSRVVSAKCLSELTDTWQRVFEWQHC